MNAALTDALSALWPSFAGFAWPWLLLALPLPWLVRWLLPPARSASAALKVPYGERLDAIPTPSGGTGGTRMAWLLFAAWCALCVAAARPQAWGEVLQPPQAGRDLMLAVDLSGSMGEQDMRLGGAWVDRLTAAKAVIADFLARRAGDRVGLLVFGQKAYALTPLTLDRDSVREQLGDTVIGLAGRETAIGDAIGLAVKRLRAGEVSQAASRQHVLILLTDGVNNAGVLDPLKAAELASDAGVRIHTVAFGGDGEGLSVFGFRLPSLGGPEMDEATLQRISDLTGGRSFRARDTESLAGIYAEIDRLEPVRRPGTRVRPRHERYPWPLGVALACALLALAWPRTRLA